MPFIQNVAATDVLQGNHRNPGPNSMLIQILDPAGWFPEPRHNFTEAHRFEFLDIERDDENVEEFGINMRQAEQIVALLQKALEKNINVIVHCFAGICRSGAVAEVGIILGFDDTGTYRCPNLLVKHSLMKVLGLTYDSDEKHYRVHAEPEDEEDGIIQFRSSFGVQN